MRKRILVACFTVLTNIVFSQTSYWLGFEPNVLKADYVWDGFGFSHEKYGTTYIVKKKGEDKTKLSFPKNYLSGDSIVFYKYDNYFSCDGNLIETKIAFNQIQGLTWTNYAQDIDFCYRMGNISFILPFLHEDISYPYDVLRGAEKKSFLEENSKLRKNIPLEKLVRLKFLNIYRDVAVDFKSMKRLSGLPALAYIESTENFTSHDDCASSSSSFYFPYSEHEKNLVFLHCMDSLSGIKRMAYLSSPNLFYLPYNFDEPQIAQLSYFPSNVNWDDLLAFDLTPLYTGIKPAYLTQENLTKRVNDLRFFQHALLRQKFNLRYSSIDSVNAVYLKKEKQLNVPKIDTLGKSFAVKINHRTIVNVDNGRLNGTIKLWRYKHGCGAENYDASLYWLKAGKIEAEINYFDDREKVYGQPPQTHSGTFCFRNTTFLKLPCFGFVRSDSLYYEFSYPSQTEFVFHSVYYYKKNISIVKLEYDERYVRDEAKTYYTLRKIHLRDKNGNIRIITSADPDFKEYSDLLNTLKVDFVCH